jgi:hypothetical protein
MCFTPRLFLLRRLFSFGAGLSLPVYGMIGKRACDAGLSLETRSLDAVQRAKARSPKGSECRCPNCRCSSLIER